MHKDIDKLSEIAKEVQAKIQQDFEHIDPLLGVRAGLRNQGFPVDVLTVDCLKTRKRITFLLHDEQPNVLAYQFGFIDKDPEVEFTSLAFDEFGFDTLYAWIEDYFSQEEK